MMTPNSMHWMFDVGCWTLDVFHRFGGSKRELFRGILSLILSPLVPRGERGKVAQWDHPPGKTKTCGAVVQRTAGNQQDQVSIQSGAPLRRVVHDEIKFQMTADPASKFYGTIEA